MESIIDMDQPFWIMLFPIIYWLMLHTVYEIDEATFFNLKIDNEMDTRKTKVNLFAVAGGLYY